jgi:hypothetical protein
MPTLTEDHWKLLRADLKKDVETASLLEIKRLLGEVGRQVILIPEQEETPEPETSRKKPNVSEVAISYRLNFLKLILRQNVTCKPLEVLRLAATLLELHCEQCQQGVFIDCKSSVLLRGCGSQLEDLSTELDALNPTLITYEGWHPEPEDPTPQELKIEVILRRLLRIANGSAESKESAWDDILEKARATRCEWNEIKCYESLQIATGKLRLIHTDAPKPKGAKNIAQAASRNDILRATIAAMYGIRQIRETCYFRPADHEVERLYVVCTGFRADLLPRDLSRGRPNRSAMGSQWERLDSQNRAFELISRVRGVFCDALRRQRLSPFSTAGFYHLPRIPSGGFTDGQVAIGVWDDEERHLSWSDRILLELKREKNIGNKEIEKGDLIERVWKLRPELETSNSKTAKKSGLSGIYKALSKLHKDKQIVITRGGQVRLKSRSAKRK